MPTLTELTGESTRIDWRRPEEPRRMQRSTPPQSVKPPVPGEAAAIGRARHDAAQAYLANQGRADDILNEVPPIEEFDTAYERFEPKDRPDRVALVRRERALSAVADVVRWSKELNTQKAAGEAGSNRLRANIAGWEKDAEAFLAACSEHLAEANDFWQELESRFQVCGEAGLHLFSVLRPGIIGEVALKRLYYELGYEVRDNPLTDPFGIDFLTRKPSAPGFGGTYPGGLEIHQVKSHQVKTTQEAAAIVRRLVERVPFGEGRSTSRSRQENAELSGWGEFFKRFGQVLPGLRYHLPYREELIAANGVMNPAYKALIVKAIRAG